MIVLKTMSPEWHPSSVATANFMTNMYNVDYDVFDQVRENYPETANHSDGGWCWHLHTNKDSHYDCL